MTAAMRSTLVLDPGRSFPRLRDDLSLAGWQLVSSADASLLPDEPEYAVFERGAAQRAFYTFNPVCRLRVLDLPAGADPDTLARADPVGRPQIESWMVSDDERTLLRGVLAVRQLPDLHLLAHVQALRQHPHQLVAAAAVRVSHELRDASRGASTEAVARGEALAAIEVLRAQVMPLLQSLSHDRSGEALGAVTPRDDDYAKAFIGDAVDKARDAYRGIWGTFEMRYPAATHTVITCTIVPAGMLGEENELSRRFPGGYRGIAHWLDPHRVWVCWKCLAPGASAGMAYDGLVWLDDHWAWFPKPYRAIL